MKASANSHRFVTVLFGPLGDTLMALSLYDDLISLAPDATLLILTRRNAVMIRELASEYPGVEVREIPRGIKAVSFFASILNERGCTLLTLGLVSVGYSLPLRLFFLLFGLLPGNRTIGFHDPLLDVALDFDIRYSMLDNLRRLLPYALPTVALEAGRPAQMKMHTEKPVDLPYKKGEYIVAHLFGVSIPHTLPPERWQRIFTAVRKEYPKYAIILTGTEAQREVAEEVAFGIAGVTVVTHLSLSELASVIDDAALYIGIDTGVTHLAGLLNQKSLIIRHCSDPSWIPSYNPNARILFNSSRCQPDDPLLCGIVEEKGKQYRRSTYDISEVLILASIRLALATSTRDVPTFAGVIDEAKI
ncbi:MAG: waaC [Parcubacteria group bacterium]|nr:waaC [Parcubacteria group bacterium]